MKICKFCENSILANTYGWGDVRVCKKCNSYFSIENDVISFLGIEIENNGNDYITIEKLENKIIIVLCKDKEFTEFKTELKISDYNEDIDQFKLLKSFYENLAFV